MVNKFATRSLRLEMSLEFCRRSCLSLSEKEIEADRARQQWAAINGLAARIVLRTFKRQVAIELQLYVAFESSIEINLI